MDAARLGGPTRALSIALRRFAEAPFEFGQIVKVDPEEAAGNYEHAFDAVLSGQYSVWDVCRDLECPLDSSNNGFLATLLLVRNWRQHNADERFKPMWSTITRQATQPNKSSTKYLLAAIVDDDSNWGHIEYYVPLLGLLTPSRRDQRWERRRQEALPLIKKHLMISEILDHASSKKIGVANTMVEFYGVIARAMPCVYQHVLNLGLVPEDEDSQAFAAHFRGMSPFSHAELRFRTYEI